MRNQATTKLLLHGMGIGLVLAAGVVSSGAQSAPAQLNDVHKQLIQSTQGAPDNLTRASPTEIAVDARETRGTVRYQTCRRKWDTARPV